MKTLTCNEKVVYTMVGKEFEVLVNERGCGKKFVATDLTKAVKVRKWWHYDEAEYPKIDFFIDNNEVYESLSPELKKLVDEEIEKIELTKMYYKLQ